MKTYLPIIKIVIFLICFFHLLWAQDSNNQFMQAIGKGNIEEVKKILDSGSNPNELTKIGADVEELPDGLIIRGNGDGINLSPAPVSGYGDHRIVMAMSLAGMALDDEMTIDTAEAMNVTFPEYVTLMTQLGAKLILTE